MDDEFACVTVTAAAGEPEAAFKSRLVAFWSHYLRSRPDDYERVYAEATAFETVAGRVTRQYMVEVAGVPTLTASLTEAGLAFDPVDMDDLYTRYEAAPPDWFQIEH